MFIPSALPHYIGGADGIFRSSMIIRKTTMHDIPELLEIYAGARDFMRRNGNPHQWWDYYPPRGILEEDVSFGRGYAVVNDNGKILATFMFQIGEDEMYNVIENGAWLNNDAYGVIHRVASSGVVKGMLPVIVGFCSDFCDNIRMDTHEDNKIMQHLLEKNGFIRCGTVHIFNGDPRIAYQKIIAGKENK